MLGLVALDSIDAFCPGVYGMAARRRNLVIASAAVLVRDCPPNLEYSLVVASFFEYLVVAIVRR